MIRVLHVRTTLVVLSGVICVLIVPGVYEYMECSMLFIEFPLLNTPQFIYTYDLIPHHPELRTIVPSVTIPAFFDLQPFSCSEQVRLRS
jgi:hypothetical protein